MNQVNNEQKETVGLWITGIVAPVGLLTIVAGPLVLCWQVLLWLRDGYWTHIKLGSLLSRFGLEPTSISWLGVRRLLVWVYSVEMWIGLIWAGVLICVVGISVAGLIDGEKI